MARGFFRYRVALLVSVCVLSLLGCAGSVPSSVRQLPERVELNSVPFFRGELYQSAPGALASLLSLHGIVITPGLLDKPLQLPGAEDQLQQNMQKLAREHGMLVYPLDDNLSALLAQIAAGFPVLLRFSEGAAFWAKPRYGVLVGYDRGKQTVLLRAGQHRRLEMSFSAFAAAWNSAGHWAVLIQAPEQLPAQVDRQRWLRAASELARVGQEQAANRATQALGGEPTAKSLTQ